jgi:hypothetical protein
MKNFLKAVSGFTLMAFALGVGVMFADYQLNKRSVKTYSVCFYDAINRSPDCSLVVKASSYEMVGGCATFTPGEETVCGILLIAPEAKQ